MSHIGRMFEAHKARKAAEKKRQNFFDAVGRNKHEIVAAMLEEGVDQRIIDEAFEAYTRYQGYYCIEALTLLLEKGVSQHSRGVNIAYLFTHSDRTRLLAHKILEKGVGEERKDRLAFLVAQKKEPYAAALFSDYAFSERVLLAAIRPAYESRSISTLRAVFNAYEKAVSHYPAATRQEKLQAAFEQAVDGATRAELPILIDQFFVQKGFLPVLGQEAPKKPGEVPKLPPGSIIP